MFQEFQAVVLAAGKGSRMPEMTANIPKCLLPVGNKPLVWYPLYKLQQLGFLDVILIVFDNHKVEIQNALEDSELNIKIDYFTIGDEDLGTADSLRLISDKIKTDVVILSCDLVSDVNISEVLDLFRKHNASMCALFFNPPDAKQITVPGPKAKYKPGIHVVGIGGFTQHQICPFREHTLNNLSPLQIVYRLIANECDLVGVDTQTNRLVFLASASDFESNVGLPKSLIKKHGTVTMHSRLIDSHLYVLKNWIVKYLQNESSISTIKGELLPHIIRKQLQRPSKVNELNMSVVNNKANNDLFHFAKESELELLIRDTSTFNDHCGDCTSCYHNDIIRCFAYIAKPEVYGVRVNTLPSFCSVNAKIIDKWETIAAGKELLRINPKAGVKSSQVDEKCIIWELTQLNEKTSFKNSIIGRNCEVQNFSRVFNSILMSNVVIKERVAVENCIVCDGVTIESGSQVKNCLIGCNHTVSEQSNYSNEVLTVNDRLMEF